MLIFNILCAYVTVRNMLQILLQDVTHLSLKMYLLLIISVLHVLQNYNLIYVKFYNSGLFANFVNEK